MSDKEKQQYLENLQRGLELSHYRMLRDKAMRNLTVIISDEKGVIREVSAREHFVRLYHEEVPSF